MKKTSVLPRTPRGQATRESLLAALEAEILGVGFDGATSTSVAAQAGVATGTFYGYFEDKHAALAALFAQRLDELIADAATTFTADHLLDHGMDQTMRAVVDVVADHYRAHAAVLRAALARIPADERLRTIYWEGHQRSAALIEQFIRRGTAAGMVRRDQSATVLAHTVLILTQSLLHPVVANPEDAGLVDGVRSEVARALTMLLAPTSAKDEPRGR
jgi:AcrR family transcriptional regulator